MPGNWLTFFPNNKKKNSQWILTLKKDVSMLSWDYYQVRNKITVPFVDICTGNVGVTGEKCQTGLLREWSLIACSVPVLFYEYTASRLGHGGRRREGGGRGLLIKKINKFEFSFALLAKNSGSHITLFCLTSRSDMHSDLTDYSLLPRNKLKHIHRQPLSFCLSVYLFFF